jgi:hypothetical protein
MKKTLIRISFLSLLLVALPLAAQTYDWSMVGSCGAIHNPGAGYTFTGPTFTFSGTYRLTLTARYRVTNTYGSATSKQPGWTTLYAALTDNSANGSVTATLYRVDKCNNTQTALCAITSTNSSDPHCESCTFNSTDIDFANYEYYVEVKLARSDTVATEALHSVALN